MNDTKDELIERMKNSIDNTIKNMMEEHYDEMSEAIDITRKGVIDFLESEEGKEFVKEVAKQYIIGYAEDWLPGDEQVFDVLQEKMKEQVSKFELVLKEEK